MDEKKYFATPNPTTRKRTRLAILIGSFFDEPFLAFYAGLLIFILRKDLKASIFQITLLTMLKPAVSILSFFWGALLKHNQHLRSSFLFAAILARIPFLLPFFFDHVWYMIFASAFYMLFSRASIPAWMEILKINLPKAEREKYFSFGITLGFIESIFLALVVGSALTHNIANWKIICLLSASVSLIGILYQGSIPLESTQKILPKPSFPSLSLKAIQKPLKEGLLLLKRRPDFAHFQIGSMANAFGLMLAAPALIIFLSDSLSISHFEMTLCRYMYMGLGFVASASLWTRLLGKFDLNRLSSLIGVGFGLFSLFLIFGIQSHFWVYLAYLLYGFTQAGSRLIWNLSGAIFSEKESSSLYSSINILSVGLRGLIAPILGGFLCNYFSPIYALGIGTLISFYGAWHMAIKAPKVFSTLEKEESF